MSSRADVGRPHRPVPRSYSYSKQGGDRKSGSTEQDLTAEV